MPTLGSMTGSTPGPACFQKLTLVNIIVAELTILRKSGVLNTPDAVHRPWFVTVRTPDRLVLPNEREIRLAVVKRRNVPFHGRVAFRTTVPDHLRCKLPLVYVGVTVPTPKPFKTKHQFVDAGLPMARFARCGDVGAAELKPRLTVPGERKCRRFESADGVTDRAIVRIRFHELSLVVVCVTIRTIFERQEEPC